MGAGSVAEAVGSGLMVGASVGAVVSVGAGSVAVAGADVGVEGARVAVGASGLGVATTTGVGSLVIAAGDEQPTKPSSEQAKKV